MLSLSTIFLFVFFNFGKQTLFKFHTSQCFLVFFKCEIADPKSGRGTDSDASDSEKEGSLASTTPPKKNSKCLCKFREERVPSYTWISKFPKDSTKALCALCRKDFRIGHRGKNYIKKHSKSDRHKVSVVSDTRQTLMIAFAVKTNDVDQIKKCMVAEITMVCHTN